MKSVTNKLVEQLGKVNKIVSFTISVLVILLLVGCSDVPNYNKSVPYNLTRIHSVYFDAHVVEEIGNCCFVVEDKTTGVLYLVVGGYSSCAITPLYDESGDLKLYENREVK